MDSTKFYENMARKLKKEKKLYQFGQFIGAMMHLQYEKSVQRSETTSSMPI